jgi:hypothetical protein
VRKSLFSILKPRLTASASDSRPKGVIQGDLELRAACSTRRRSVRIRGREVREGAYGDGKGSVEAVEDAGHDEEKTEVNVHRQLGEMPSERRDLLVRRERLDLDQRTDSARDVGRSGRVKSLEKRLFDALRPDLHDLDAKGKILKRETSHLGLRMFLHLRGRRE